MQSLLRCHRRQLRSLLPIEITLTIRHASLISAISRGVRKGANSIDRLGTSRRSERQDTPSFTVSGPPRSRIELERSDKPSRQRPWKRKGLEKNHDQPLAVSYEAPTGVPYTTAGSEFLYGTFAVKAALEAKRRRIHQLYVWKGVRSEHDAADESILRLARLKRIPIQAVAGLWEKTLMKMSGQRPHNGYILETSPIPKLPVVALEKVEAPTNNVVAKVGAQTTEDELINGVFAADGSLATLWRNRRPGRYPLLLWLDRVTDTGNLGAIIRTAYFFGVDAIIVPEHGTAPFSPVTIKASAGAAEWVPILVARKEADFVRLSQENGWKFFAAVAPDSASTKVKTDKLRADAAADALSNGPCVLMVGNEGEGLRNFLQRAADESISIHGVQRQSAVVDSLNVSVAAALLMARFFDMRPVTQAMAQSALGKPQVVDNSPTTM